MAKILHLTLLTSACVFLTDALAQTVSTPEQPSMTHAGELDSSSADSTIVVTGIRASAQKAQDIKREAPVVVEAITATELGRFTDPSIVDALGRVPGVQIQRSDGPGDPDGQSNSGDQISIRGLGAQYVQTTINGRPALSLGVDSGSRGFNFDNVPSEILGGVLVYKTSSASLLEAGMAGSVDVRTIRPVEYLLQAKRDSLFAVTGSGSYDDIYKKVSPRVSGIAAKTFADGALGLYLAGVYANEKKEQPRIFRYDTQTSVNIGNSDGSVRTLPNVWAPGQTIFQLDQRTSKRRVLSAGAEFKPDDRLDVNADFTFNRYDINVVAPGIFLGFNTNYDYSNEIFAPTGIGIRDNTVVFFDSSRILANKNGVVGGSYGQPNGQFAGGLENVNQDMYTGGINIRYDTGPVVVTADYGRSDLTGTTDFRNVKGDEGAALLAGQTRADLYFDDTSGKDLPTYRIGPQFTDTTLFGDPGLYVQSRQLLERMDFGRLDVEGKPFEGVKVRIGADYTRTTNDFRAANPRARIPSAPEARAAFYGTSTYNILGLTGVPEVSAPAACAVTPRLCTLTNLGVGSFTGAFPTNPDGDPADPLKLSGQSGYIREENRGFYAEGDFSTNLGGMPVDGNVGVRAVDIREFGIGISSVATFLTTAVFDPAHPSVNILVSDNASYWRVLPTFNVTAHPGENLNLRFGVGKTMSLPEYSLLRPSSNVNIYESGARGQANAGNLHIKPTLSWNYDVTSEYYFPNGGAAVASLFYKKVTDFANTETVVGANVPGQTGLFDVTEAINSQSGHAQGFEIGTNQPFTFLPQPWDGFGLQSNFTFVDSKFDAAANDLSAPKGNFPGASKYNANATAYFEKNGIGIRAAYTYRSRYVYQLGTDGTSLLANSQGNLDASVSYKFDKLAELIFTATNLTGEHQALRYERANAFAGYSERPRTYSVALRLAL